MRTHTALHALCGVVWRDYGALVTGGNMEPGSGRMDFEFERMSGDLVDAIEATVNAELAAARDVRVDVLPRDEAFAIPDLIRTKVNLLPEGIEEIRTIEIVGLDLQADGGTHVANTREVGGIRVTGYESKGRINKRIRIELVDPPDRLTSAGRPASHGDLPCAHANLHNACPGRGTARACPHHHDDVGGGGSPHGGPGTEADRSVHRALPGRPRPQGPASPRLRSGRPRDGGCGAEVGQESPEREEGMTAATPRRPQRRDAADADRLVRPDPGGGAPPAGRRRRPTA